MMHFLASNWWWLIPSGVLAGFIALVIQMVVKSENIRSTIFLLGHTIFVLSLVGYAIFGFCAGIIGLILAFIDYAK